MNFFLGRFSTLSTGFCRLFFFSCYGDHRDLHSFPTRRSSDLCGDHVARASGVLVRVAASFEEQSRPAALARYPALGDPPTVVSIAPGSAAEAAGLARNDVITTVNGEPIATTGKPLEAYAAL